MRRYGLFTAALWAIPVLLVACTQGEPPADSNMSAATTAAATPTLDVATDLGVLNARMPLPGLLTAGQPTVEQVEALSEAGFTRFISLRPPDENGAGWEEVHAAEHHYDFERLPISGAGSLTHENVEAFAALLEEAGDQPTVLYCASSNRVGAMLALKAHWVDGASAEEALELGLSGGMTGLQAPVRELLGLAPEG